MKKIYVQTSSTLRPTIGLMLKYPPFTSQIWTILHPLVTPHARSMGTMVDGTIQRASFLVPGFCHKCFWILMNSCLTRRLWLQNKIYVYIYSNIYIYKLNVNTFKHFQANSTLITHNYQLVRGIGKLVIHPLKPLELWGLTLGSAVLPNVFPTCQAKTWNVDWKTKQKTINQ